MAKILDKDTMYRLYERGLFGNKPRTWMSIRDLDASDFAGTVTLRYVGARGGRFGMYSVPKSDALRITEEQCRIHGLDPHWMTANESAPDDQLVLQGEAARSERYFDLRYGTEPGVKMRTAMDHPQYASGLQALTILKSALWPASFEDMSELFDQYPDSVIEFSAYRIAVGDCANRNTFIWEVRNY